MDPFATLGISQDATEKELKRAFRKKAMKWHPDRANDSPEANDRFQEISLAYQILSRKIKNEKRSGQYQSNPERPQDRPPASNDDDVFSDVMLEYAIELVRSGLTNKEVKTKMSQNGFDAELVDSIVDKAFKFQDEFIATSNRDKNKDSNKAGLVTRKFDYRSIQALLGKRKPDSKSRKTISDYHETFNDLYEKEQAGSIFPVSKNTYLSKVLNRSLLLFILVATVVYFLPGLTARIPLGLIDYFQLPNIILSLMVIWSAYRKLWLLSFIGLAIFTATQLYYYYSMPIAMEQEFTTLLFISLLCFLPFILLTHLSNFFYYRKAKEIIESVNDHYPLVEEKLILIKNRGGVSRFSALLLSMLMTLYFLHMIPQNGSLDKKFNQLFSIDKKTESKDFKQFKVRISESERLFQIAEKHFNHNPPEYENAKMAYFKAANYGSLLSSYKLGYMYVTGKGGVQDDDKAFYYFNQAIHSSLASQPHKLSMATKWLSESYNSLGFMYLGGYGTLKNQQKAMEMFRQALKYDPSNGMRNVKQTHAFDQQNLRTMITPPEFGPS